MSFATRWYNSILICFSSTNISGKGEAGVEIFKRKRLICGNELRWKSKVKPGPNIQPLWQHFTRDQFEVPSVLFIALTLLYKMECTGLYTDVKLGIGFHSSLYMFLF